MANAPDHDPAHEEPVNEKTETSSNDNGNQQENSAQSTHSDRQSDLDPLFQEHRKKHSKYVAYGLTWRDKAWTHYKKYWIWYTVALVCGLAILLPILFLVIVPKIVQNVLNGNDLPLLGGTLRVLTPETLSLTLDTHLHAPLPVRIEPFTLSLFNADAATYSPFGDLEMPKMHVSKSTNITIPVQDVRIRNESELVRWFNQVFLQESVDVSVEAPNKLDVYLGVLHSRPSLRKVLTLPGLKNLAGSSVTNLTFMIPPDEKGHNIKGQLNLPNAGVLAIGIGNQTLNLVSDTLRIGEVKLFDVTLNPGPNDIYFEGNLYLDQFSENLGELLDGQKGPLNHGYIEFNATGNSTIVNGQHVRYLETVLSDKKILFQIPIITFLSDLINGLLKANNGTSIIDALSEVVGNRTLIQGVVDNFNQTQSAQELRNQRRKRKLDIRGAMALNMLRWGLMKPGPAS